MPVFYCAIIPACGAPYCVREGEGIVVSSVAECVYTLAHAIGFVTRSLCVAPAFTDASGEKEREREDEEQSVISRQYSVLLSHLVN